MAEADQDREQTEKEFAALVQTYQRRLIGLAYRLLGGNADAASDVVQDTFIALWRQMRGRGAAYVAPERIDLYLLRSVHNRCRDILRACRVSQICTLQEDPPNTNGDPVTEAHGQLLADAVTAAVAALPETQRVVFVLSHYEGLRYQEIADLLDCPIGTVASRKNQAVITLRHVLRDWIDNVGPHSGEGKV